MANFQDIIEYLRYNRRSDEANKNIKLPDNVLLTPLEGGENYHVDRNIFENNFTFYKRLFSILSTNNVDTIYLWENNSDKKYLYQKSNLEYFNLLNGAQELPPPSELAGYSIETDYSIYFYDVAENNVVIKSRDIPEIILFPDYLYYDPNTELIKDITNMDYTYSFSNPNTIFGEILSTILKFKTQGFLSNKEKQVTVTKSQKAGQMKLFPFMQFNKGLKTFNLKYAYYNKNNPESVFTPNDDDCAFILNFQSVGGFLSFLNETLFTQGIDLSSSGSPIKKNFQKSFKEIIISPLEKNLKSNVQLYYRDALEILYYLPSSISIELSSEILWLLLEEGIRKNGLSNDIELAEENIYIKILENLLNRENEENNFIERLSKPIDKNGTLILEYLYDRMNGENGVKFASLVNKAWRKTRFVNPDTEKNPEFKSTDGPLMLPYGSKKWLGLYFSNAKVDFESNKEKQRILRIAYETGKYEYEMRPGLKTDNLVSTPVQIIDYFWYHPFYPISLKNIEKQDTEIKLDSIVPAFMLKANRDQQFWSNVITSAEYATDIITTLSGIGNIAKFRYLANFATKASRLRFVSEAGEAVATVKKVVAATAAVVEITSGTVNTLLKLTSIRDVKWGKSLSEYLFWLELLSLSGELSVTIHNGLRKSAKEILEHEDDIRKTAKNADETKEIDDVLEQLKHEGGHIPGSSTVETTVETEIKAFEVGLNQFSKIIAEPFVKMKEAMPYFNHKSVGNAVKQVSITNCGNTVEVVIEFLRTGKLRLAEPSGYQDIEVVATKCGAGSFQPTKIPRMKELMGEGDIVVIYGIKEKVHIKGTFGESTKGHYFVGMKKGGELHLFDGQTGEYVIYDLSNDKARNFLQRNYLEFKYTKVRK